MVCDFLFSNNVFSGFAIELPWLENQKMKSCIPEASYTLKARYSEKFNHHLILENFPRRSLIMKHPVNDAKTELLGCITPVTFLSGIGKGTASKPLLQKLVSLCYQAFDRKEIVTLIIKS